MARLHSAERLPVVGSQAALRVRIARILALLLMASALGAPSTQFSPTVTALASSSSCRETAGVIRQATVVSTVYGASVPISVYLPPCYATTTGLFPVLYLLHGGNADETQWPDVGVQPAADALIRQGTARFIVVMPGGAYRTKLDYTAFVLHDLLPDVERQFRVRTAGSGRAIGGISLGGYWALSLAFTHPQDFAAVGGHSPVVKRGRNDDPLALAQKAQGLAQLKVTLDVGNVDGLRADTARLAQLLQARGVAVRFGVYPGGHDRAYWRTQTAANLQFYLNAIANTSSPRPIRSTECA